MTNKPGTFEWLIITASTVLFLGLAFYVLRVLPSGELGDKEKWRVLQYVESVYRGDPPPAAPLYIPVSSDLTYAALGMPTGDTRWPYVWILPGDDDAGDPSSGCPPRCR
ncbi:hypothetical protein CR152_02960 [Massilia violaceinigra]|uniref:Uncharacterized protein n=1 Tax=Massilia violaceinigra TaxID=2045208 RepID=A0A2D2DF30_9BURK|nr:hypothetical protein [Massilia violaceinigra]ATQ73580.1 hypothetical protein CR152_02960 [Massilia violaceinigra]